MISHHACSSSLGSERPRAYQKDTTIELPETRACPLANKPGLFWPLRGYPILSYPCVCACVFVCLFVCLFGWLCVCSCRWFVCLCVFVWLFVCLFVRVFVCLLCLCVSVCGCLSVCLGVVCLCVCLFVVIWFKSRCISEAPRLLLLLSDADGDHGRVLAAHCGDRS